MDKGKIYEIVWDNDCFDCDDICDKHNLTSVTGNNRTEEKNCFSKDANNSTLNDPTFYVTWFGTDKNKRQLKTANLAMSKFKHYSIGSLAKSVKNLFS